MQLFDKYLSLLYCKAIRTASEVGLLKRHHKNKTIWIMNVSIYFPFLRTLLKTPVEAGISQSIVYMSSAVQNLKFTSLFSVTSYWFYASGPPTEAASLYQHKGELGGFLSGHWLQFGRLVLYCPHVLSSSAREGRAFSWCRLSGISCR